MTTTLVTGASGHLGANLIRALLAEGRRVRVLVRRSSNLEGLEGLDVEIRYGDILDAGSVREAVEGCRVVHHCAAVFKVYAKDPEEEIIRPAVEGTRNILDASLDAGVEKVVYVGSTIALGAAKGLDALRTEEHWNEDPCTPYARAKTESEKWAHRFFERTGLPIVFILPGWILGPYDYRLTPSMEVIQYTCRLGGLFYMDGGVSPVDVRDVARGMVLAEKKGSPGRRYNLGGENVDFRTLMKTISSITGGAAPRVKLPKGVVIGGGAVMDLLAKVLPFEPPMTRAGAEEFAGRYWYYDCTRAAEELGYTFRPKEEVLYETVRWLAEIGTVGSGVVRNLERYRR